jgi:adenylate cyclase
MKLRAKAIALFFTMTLAPVAAAVGLLVELNQGPVRDREIALQRVALSEIAGASTRVLYEAENDAIAVAAILGRAADGAMRDEDAIEAVRALVATRPNLGAVRFEVPSAGVNTVIRQDTSVAEIAASTPELRAEADKRPVVFTLLPPRRGLVVARIPMARAGAPAGYVSVNVNLARLEVDLQEIFSRRFLHSDVHMLIATHDQRAIFAFDVPGTRLGESVTSLPVWGKLSGEMTWTGRVSLFTGHQENGVRMLGTIENIPELGWVAAIWRPESEVLAALRGMRLTGAAIAAAAALLAVLVGFLAGAGVTRPVLDVVRQVRLIGQRKWRELSPGRERDDELGELSRALGHMAEDLQHGEREAQLRSDLSRFMSKGLVDALVRGEHSLSLGGKRTEVSVLFADVVGFTPLAESREAEQIVAVLNELFSVLTEVVFRHGGTVDKFIGDCIMAVWGAPMSQPDHAAKALAAAEDMMRFLETANEGWREKYDIEIRLGIGVNSGEAIVGNIGSDKRMEYTVIGDVVNVAARLESIAQPNQVLVADATRKLAGDAFVLRRLGGRKLTGRQTSTEVFALDIG